MWPESRLDRDNHTLLSTVDRCATCQLELPPESSFCPMCGSRRTASFALSAAPAGTITAEGSAPSPVPNPALTLERGSGPAFVPQASGNYQELSAAATNAHQPRKTIPLTAEAAEALTRLQPEVAIPPAPPQRVAKPAPQAAGGYRVPGTPARIPISPRPGRIVFGAVMIGFGLWVLLGLLPSRKAELDEALAIAGTGGALALIVFGLFVAIAGAVYRSQVETMCRRCNVQVIGWKRPFGLQCPMGGHYARLSWFLVILASVFWTVTLAIIGGLAYLIFT